MSCGSEATPDEHGAEAASDPRPAASDSANQEQPLPEVVDEPLEAYAYEPMFEARPFEPSETLAKDLAMRDPAVAGWSSELQVPRMESALAGLIELRLAASTESSAGPLDDFSVRLPAAASSGATRVQVEVVACEPTGEGRWAAECLVSIVRTNPSSGARADVRLLSADEQPTGPAASLQRTLRLATEWTLEGEALSLTSSRELPAPDGGRTIVADGTLFEDRTLFAFGADVGFAEEFLRGPDAYYFHSDRLTGYDLICNQGLALGDLDGDGLEDVYVGMPPGLPNRLYLRQPDGGTRDVAGDWRVAFLDSTRSALILDLDGDGKRDLAAAVGADIAIGWGTGSGFESFSVLSLGGSEDVFGLSAADPDRDGDLDLYACRYSSQGVMQGNPTPYHDARNGSANTYWRNAGGREFEDATAAVGFDVGNSRYSFAAQWEDYDDDGDLDLYVANDFGRNHYWRNEGGHFTDVAGEVGAEDMAAGMGVSSGDVDGDGDLDLYVSNIYAAEGVRITARGEEFLGGRSASLLPAYQHHARGNSLLLGDGAGNFTDASLESGSNRGGWAWGAQLFDVDNDGDLDVYSPNGFVSGTQATQADEYFWRHVIANSPEGEVITDAYRDAWKAMQYLCFEAREGWNGDEGNVLLLGDGKGKFIDASGISGADVREDARSVVPVDWDRDGFLDLLVKSRGAPRLRLLRNRGTTAGSDAWLVLELAGAGLDAVGAHVWVETDQGTLRRGLTAGDGFLAQSPSRLHFGLGSAQDVRSLEVRWPDGTRQRLEGGLEPGGAYRITRGEEDAEPMPWEPMPLVAAATEPPARELQGFAGRTVLCAKLPLGPTPLPAFEEPGRKVSELAGGPLLVSIWRLGDSASEGQLRRLAGIKQHLDAADLKVVPLALDSGAALARGRSLVRELGLDEHAGYADGWTLQALEVLLLEVYHRAETNPVPTSLLIDRAGQLCVVYQGPVASRTLLEDVRDLAKMEPSRPGCARLQRGRWLRRPPRRDPDSLSKVFASLAYTELAAYYRGLATRGR